MTKDNPLRHLLEQLNLRYKLSDDFKVKVALMVDKLDGFPLDPNQLEMLVGKVKETYERQYQVETCREETLKSLEKIQFSVNSYATALSDITQKLNQAETALSKLLALRPQSVQPIAEEKGIAPFDKQKAKAMAAFAGLSSKNSRIN